MTLPTNPFISLTRIELSDTSHVIDALDVNGRAWWLIVGNPDAPEGWTELLPLPGDEPVSAAYTLEPSADGEVAELVAWMRNQATIHTVAQTQWAKRFLYAADLLERLAVPSPAREGPSDKDLLELRRSSSWLSSSDEFINIARAALARWGR